MEYIGMPTSNIRVKKKRERKKKEEEKGRRERKDE